MVEASRHVVFGPEVFQQRHGGVSRYFLELHRRLPGFGIATTIFAGAHCNAYLQGVGGVHGSGLPERMQDGRLVPSLLRVNDFAVSTYLQTFARRAIYHQTYFSGRAGLRHGGPHVVTAYDVIRAKFPQYFPAADPTLERQGRAFAAADLVLAISHTTKRDIEDVFGVEPDRVVVTHLGVTPPVPVTHEEARGARPYLLYVGQRAGYKNWARFVEAYATSAVRDDLAVVCAGHAFTPEERHLLAGLGVADRVTQVAADDLALSALYRDAEAFVYPSLYEGFGLPPLEAMARGCPVVAARTGAVPEVLGDAAVYVDPADLQSIAEGLVQITNSVRRAEIIKAGLVVARSYSWDRTAELTAQAYRSLG